MEEASRRLKGLPATVVRANFTAMASVLREEGIASVDGILLDIGVSSHQLDTPERGFSYHADAPLDMRMSQEGTTAADLVNTWDENSGGDFYRYGEEKYSRLIARAVVKAREKDSPYHRRLAEVIRDAVPARARRDGHPARRVFQALRIAVNGELDCLSSALDTAFRCLSDGGRLAVITFHSLEDRMVKQRFASYCEGCICPPDFPQCVCGRTPAWPAWCCGGGPPRRRRRSWRTIPAAAAPSCAAWSGCMSPIRRRSPPGEQEDNPKGTKT